MVAWLNYCFFVQGNTVVTIETNEKNIGMRTLGEKYDNTERSFNTDSTLYPQNTPTLLTHVCSRECIHSFQVWHETCGPICPERPNHLHLLDKQRGVAHPQRCQETTVTIVALAHHDSILNERIVRTHFSTT